MEIKCTPQELKELLKKEQTECKSECSEGDIIDCLSEKLCSALEASCDNQLKVE